MALGRKDWETHHQSSDYDASGEEDSTTDCNSDYDTDLEISYEFSQEMDQNSEQDIPYGSDSSGDRASNSNNFFGLGTQRTPTYHDDLKRGAQP